MDDTTMRPKISAGGLGGPGELAPFLTSGRATCITRQAIAVDGSLIQPI